MPLPMIDRVDVGADGAGQLSGLDPLGGGLAELGQRGDLEHPVGDLGLEPGQHPAGERVALDRGRAG